jgi:hypothetical protein
LSRQFAHRHLSPAGNRSVTAMAPTLTRSPAAPSVPPAADDALSADAPALAPEEGAPAPSTAASTAPSTALRQRYLTVLGVLFAFFSTVRVVAYLPTIWAVVKSGDSSQHSLVTWLTWAGANLTMAAWLYEQQGQRWNRAVVVNLMNATMCIATSVIIAALRM